MLSINYIQTLSNDRDNSTHVTNRNSLRIATAPLEVSHYGYETGQSILSSATDTSRSALIKNQPASYQIYMDIGVGGLNSVRQQTAHVIGYIEDDTIPDFDGYRHWKEVYVSDGFVQRRGDDVIGVRLIPIVGRSEHAYTKYALIDGTQSYGGVTVPRTFAAKIAAPIEPEFYVIRGAVTSVDDLTDPAKLIPLTDEILTTRDASTTFTIVTNFATDVPKIDYASRNNDTLPNFNINIQGLTTSPLPEKYYIYPVTLNIIVGEIFNGLVNTADLVIGYQRIKLRTVH